MKPFSFRGRRRTVGNVDLLLGYDALELCSPTRLVDMFIYLESFQDSTPPWKGWVQSLRVQHPLAEGQGAPAPQDKRAPSSPCLCYPYLPCLQPRYSEIIRESNVVIGARHIDQCKRLDPPTFAFHSDVYLL